MITFDIAVFFALLATTVLALAWFFALPEWRRLGARDMLEMREFLRRKGRAAPEAEVGMALTRVAELRCAACGAAPECAHRLAAGGTEPVEQCPNALLLRRAQAAPRAMRR
jgi:hypothetical protein